MTAHIFDMDGTLLRGTTASLLLAAELGRDAELAALERRFLAGGHTNVEFAQTLHDTWGVVPEDVIAAAVAAAPLLRNVPEVLADIRARGERACLITMSPDYFADRLLPLGFDAVYASGFPREPRAALDPAAILTFEDKPRLARKFCDEHGLALDRAVAYGDSLSDVPLFGVVGHRIAVNADRHLADLADTHVDTDDLRDAYALARTRLDGDGGATSVSS